MKRIDNLKGQLYGEYYSYLMAIALVYFEDRMDAEDVVHDAFVKLFEQLDNGAFVWQGDLPFRGWSSRLVRQLALTRLRDDCRHKKLDADYLTGVARAESFHYDVNEETIRAFAQQLPDRQQHCFLLYYLDGCSREEIARRMQVSLSTVSGNCRLAAMKFSQLARESMIV